MNNKKIKEISLKIYDVLEDCTIEESMQAILVCFASMAHQIAEYSKLPKETFAMVGKMLSAIEYAIKTDLLK